MTRLTVSLVLAASLAATHANAQSDERQDFLQWAAAENKHYNNSDELENRFVLWQRTKARIASKQGKGFVLKANKFADWSDEELAGLVGAVDFGVSEEEVHDRHQNDTMHRMLAKGGKGGGGGGGGGGDDGGKKCNPRKQLCPVTCETWQIQVDEFTCEDCPSGCSTCTDASTCLTCYNNLELLTSGLCGCPDGSHLASNGQCVTCSSSQYFDGSNCASCGSNCTSCGNTANSCDACAATFVVDNGQCVCPDGTALLNGTCQSCPAGTYLSNGNCVACTENGCLECSSGTTCTKCNAAALFAEIPVSGDCVCQENTVPVNTGTGCSACDSNQFIANDICNDCGNGCASCSGAGSCDVCENSAHFVNNGDGSCSCPAGENWNGTECTDQLVCADNEYFTGNSCATCPGGCTSCEDLTGNCLSCVSPYVDTNGDGVCECPAGQTDVSLYGGVSGCVSDYNATRVLSPYASNSTYVDWRDRNVVGPVENQGQCGSCVPFGVSGTVESNHAITTGEYYNGSAAYLLECMDCPSEWGFYNPCTYRCDGGWSSFTLKYAQAYGVPTESDYPYSSDNRSGIANSCADNGSMDKPINSMVGDGRTYACRSVSQCRDALQKGVVTFSFYVESWFYSYYSGIISKDSCAQNESTNHCVYAIGYGTTSTGATYLIVKNSWGSNWGDDGYFKMEISDDYSQGVCGSFRNNWLSDHDWVN